MTKSFFFLIVGIILAFVSAFHFLRLALEWKIIINEWILPGWISGLIVVFGMFMSYWSLKLKTAKNKKNQEENNKQETEKSDF